MPAHDPPWIRLVTPTLPRPSLKDNTADVDRLLKALRRILNAREVRADFAFWDRI